MRAKLLIDFPHKIQSIDTLPGIESSVAVATAKQFYFLSVTDGQMQVCHDFSDSIKGDLSSYAFMENKSLLVASFNDGNLVIKSSNDNVIKNSIVIRWPYQVLQLYKIDETSIVLACNNSTFYHANLGDDGMLILPKQRIPNSSSSKNILKAVSNQRHFIAILKNVSAENQDHLVVNIWNLHSPQNSKHESFTNELLEQHAFCFPINIPINKNNNYDKKKRNKGDKTGQISSNLLYLGQHDASRSFSVLFYSPFSPSNPINSHKNLQNHHNNNHISDNNTLLLWSKYSYDGRLLFQKPIILPFVQNPQETLHFQSNSNKLYIIHESLIYVYCVVYGVEHCTLKIETPPSSSPLDTSTTQWKYALPVLSNDLRDGFIDREIFIAVSSVSTSRTTPFTSSSSSATPEGEVDAVAATSAIQTIWRCPIAPLQTHPPSSLSSSVDATTGRLLASPLLAAIGSRQDTPQQEPILNDSSHTPRPVNGVSSHESASVARQPDKGSARGVLLQLPKPLQKVLLQGKTHFLTSLHLHQQQQQQQQQLDCTGVAKGDQTVEDRAALDNDAIVAAGAAAAAAGGGGHDLASKSILGKRVRGRSYVDISSEAVEAFFDRLCDVAERKGEILASDWEMTRILLHTNTVSLQSHPLLMNLTTQSQRVDILLSIVQYATDLTERQAVMLLKYAATVSDDTLSRYTWKESRLQYLPKASMSIPSAEDAAVDQEAQDSTANSALKGKKSPKNKKSKNKATVPASDPLQDTKSTSTSITPIIYLQLMVESLLHRTAAYSSIVLIDAIKPLSISFTVLLVRLFVQSIHGIDLLQSLSDDLEGSGFYFGGSLSEVSKDERILRAISWIEALVDAHFTGIALNIKSDSQTRVGLSRVMDLISKIEMSATETEKALGLCTHIRRQILSGDLVKNQKSYGIYEVETLTI